MARLSNYSPLRRLLLQAVMCGVLIGALGLASVVSRYKRHEGELRLSAPVRFEGMGVPVPEGWKIDLREHEAGGPEVVQFSEPGDRGPLSRVLTVVLDHRDIPLPPREYLLTSGLMPSTYEASLGGGGKLSEAEETTVAGGEGYLAAGARLARFTNGQIAEKIEIFATRMLASRDIVTVKLDGYGGNLAENVALVRAVAAGITVAGQAGSASDSGWVELTEGRKARVPAGYRLLPEKDEHLIERHMLRMKMPGVWSRVTLVPCEFFPEAGDDQETFRTMLTARDEEWLNAQITRTKTGYQADLPMRAGMLFPRREELLTSASGDALLVELHAGSIAEAAGWDELLKEVMGSLTASKGKTPAELLKAGEEEVARLAEEGLPSLLDGVKQDQWWIWTDRGQAVGYDHRMYALGDPTHGSVDTHYRLGGGVTLTGRYEFETSPDFSRHNESTVLRQANGEGAGVDRLKERASLADGQYAVALLRDPSLGKGVRVTRKAPEGLVPGPWLPLVMPKLGRREMIVRGMRVPGLEGQLATAPVTVRLRPTTRPAAGAFDMEVSGTGQVITIWPGGIEMSRTMGRRMVGEEVVRREFGKKEDERH